VSEHIKSYLVSIEKYSRIIGIIMYIISVIFTCNLMLTFGSSGREKVLYLVFAIVIQSCQLISLGISLILGFIGNKAKSKMFFMGFVYLFVLSLLGTIGFFAVSQREQTTKAYKTDVKYAEMKKQLDDYDKRIAQIDKQIEIFANKGMVSKGVNPLREEKAELTARRDKLSDDLKNYTPQATSDALYSSLSEFLDVPPDSLKLGLNFAYALILELMSAGLLWFSFFLKFSVLGNQSNQQVNNQTVIVNPEKPYQNNVSLQNPIPVNSFKESDKDLQIAWLINRMKHLESKEKSADAVVKQMIQDTDLSDNSKFIQKKPVLNTLQDTDISESLRHSTSISTCSDTSNTTSTSIPTCSADVDDSIMRRYIECLFSKEKSNGSLLGRLQIADTLNLDNRICEKIHKALKSRGLIRIDGNRTFATAEKEQMINAMGLKKGIKQQGIGF